jgi:hypothetical protein
VRLLTRPTATGSLLLANAIGMAVVAAFAARAAEFPKAAMTATLCGSFGGTERSLTSATYFDTSKAGYVT